MPRASASPSRSGPLLARACAIASFLLLASPRARAGGAGDPGAPWLTQIDTVRATGMAGAMTAFASGNDALVVNPAGLGTTKAYHFEIDGVYDAKFPAEGLTVSIADSTGAPGLGTGLIFSRWGSGQLGGRGEGWEGGLGYSYRASSFYFGGVTHLLHFAGPDGAQIHTFAEDLGIMMKGNNFGFGATLKNFNFSFENMPLFPLTGAAGLSVGSDDSFHLSADYKVDLSDSSNLKHTLAWGGEMLFDRTLCLRAGYQWDITYHLGWLTAGASVVTKYFSIGAAWRRRMHGDHMEQALEAGLTMFLE